MKCHVFVKSSGICAMVIGMLVVSSVEGEEGGVARMQPDYSRLALKGDDHADDSFSLTMQAVARVYGTDADYGTIRALSGNGFSPAIHPPEGCRSLQRMHGRGQGIDVVADYLGLNLRFLGIPTPEEIRKTIKGGEVVITDGGWRTVLYTFWGVLLKVDNDRTVRGATVNGREDNPLDHIRQCWAVRKGTSRLSQHQADRLMLQRAILRMQGAEPYHWDKKLEVTFGLKAMDLWIEKMKEPHFQPEDPASSGGNARCCAEYSYQGARNVSEYLQSRVSSFPQKAQPLLVEVAKRYARVAELLKPFTVWEDGKGYRAFMGDQQKQAEHAENVLIPCREEMVAATAEIERVLAIP